MTMTVSDKFMDSEVLTLSIFYRGVFTVWKILVKERIMQRDVLY